MNPNRDLLKKQKFNNVVEFKQSLVKEDRRFAKAFTSHLLRFALSRELTAGDSIAVEDIVDKTQEGNFKLKSLIREVVLSKSFYSTRQ